MRGERAGATDGGNALSGSSPHARGTRVKLAVDSHKWRIIPACAGNAPPTRSESADAPDHPRMRGERTNTPTAIWNQFGSSPHARGTRLHLVHAGALGRIIPACAGNAASAQLTISRISDHPRMRGERAGGSRCGEC